MYLTVYICTYTRTFTHTYMYTPTACTQYCNVHISRYTSSYMYNTTVHTKVNTHTIVHMHTHQYTHTQQYTHAHEYMYVHTTVPTWPATSLLICVCMLPSNSGLPVLQYDNFASHKLHTHVQFKHFPNLYHSYKRTARLGHGCVANMDTYTKKHTTNSFHV